EMAPRLRLETVGRDPGARHRILPAEPALEPAFGNRIYRGRICGLAVEKMLGHGPGPGGGKSRQASRAAATAAEKGLSRLGRPRDTPRPLQSGDGPWPRCSC